MYLDLISTSTNKKAQKPNNYYNNNINNWSLWTFWAVRKKNLGFKHLKMMSWTGFFLDFIFPLMEILQKATHGGMLPHEPKYYLTQGSIRW